MPKPQSAPQKTDKIKPVFERISAGFKTLAKVEISGITKSRELGSYPDYFKR